MDEYSTYSYGSYDATPISNVDSGESLGVALVILFVYIIILLAIYVVSAIFLSKVFKKAGVDGWKAWVPVLNTWKMLEIGGQQGFWAILAFIPLVNIASVIMLIIAIHNINKKIGYDIGMTILAVFLPIVWVIIAGLNKQPWNDSLGSPRVDQPDFAVMNGQPAGFVSPQPANFVPPQPATYAQPQQPQPQQPAYTNAPPEPNTPELSAPQAPETQPTNETQPDQDNNNPGN